MATLREEGLQQYFDEVDKMSKQELNAEANRLAMVILDLNPKNFTNACNKSPKLKYVKDKIKNNGFKG